MWRVLLGVFAVGVGACLGTFTCRSSCGGPSRVQHTESVLVQVLQDIQLSTLTPRGDRCVDGLAVATTSGRLSSAIDGWGRPLEIRCFGDVLVLRSHGRDATRELDDLVLVRPLRPSTADSRPVDGG